MGYLEAGRTGSEPTPVDRTPSDREGGPSVFSVGVLTVEPPTHWNRSTGEEGFGLEREDMLVAHTFPGT